MISIIPARSGSIGLKNKNVLKLNNKPLIAYTIKAALKSKYINEVIVLTDSKKIANLSIRYGATVPFLRPKKLATANSLVIDSYIFCIEKLMKIKKKKNTKFYFSFAHITFERH